MGQKSIRVLIVDDIAQVRQELATMLKLATKNNEQQIDVIGEAIDGDDAIHQAQRLHPDAIIMDLEMPILNGFSATRSIKSSDPSIFIIILTIHDDPETRQKADQAGADTFIEKSASPDVLLRAIQGIRTTNYIKELL